MSECAIGVHTWDVSMRADYRFDECENYMKLVLFMFFVLTKARHLASILPLIYAFSATERNELRIRASPFIHLSCIEPTEMEFRMSWDAIYDQIARTTFECDWEPLLGTSSEAFLYCEEKKKWKVVFCDILTGLLKELDHNVVSLCFRNYRRTILNPFIFFECVVL